MPSSYSLSPVLLQPHCTRAEFDAVVEVLARAFVDDPFWRWLCRPEDFQVRLRRGMAAQLRHLALPGRVDHIPGVGAALWSPPGQWRLGLWQQLRFLPDFAAITGLTRLPGRPPSRHPVPRPSARTRTHRFASDLQRSNNEACLVVISSNWAVSTLASFAH